jgi:hypothetical protein
LTTPSFDPSTLNPSGWITPHSWRTLRPGGRKIKTFRASQCISFNSDLKHIKLRIKKWNKEFFGDIFKEKRDLKQKWKGFNNTII